MIVDFSVENYRSIKQMETLTMEAASLVSKYKELDTSNVLAISPKIAVLKSKAIYGANASGKSNLIKALDSFIKIITNSVKDDNALDEIWPFKLSTETEYLPSYFQLCFVLNNVFYRYGFQATRKEVISEWLFGSPGKKEVAFFTREGISISVNEKQFKEGKRIVELYEQEGNDIARTNSLFITVVKSFSGGLSKDIIDFIGSIIIVDGLTDMRLHTNAKEQLSDALERKKIAEFLQIADTGISSVNRYEYQKNSEQDGEKTYLAVTEHKKFDSDLKDAGFATFFMITEESEGSKKMFEISPLLSKALNEKRVLVMDEFDARFHPLLTKKIVELFNSDLNKGSQFIFATHDTNLLSAKLLRRDQICFTEKDKFGASHFYSLADFKGVRNDSSFEKDYINGRYGAIPFLGDFSTILE